MLFKTLFTKITFKQKQWKITSNISIFGNKQFLKRWREVNLLQ